MYKKFTILFLFMYAISAFGQDPVCTPIAITEDDPIIVPPPYNVVNMTGGLDTACIDVYYEQVLTTLVPTSIAVGTNTIAVDSIAIDLKGAIQGLPVGLDYACNPPSCVFLPETSACFIISGTPESSNEAKTFDLTLTMKAYNFFFPVGFELAYPDDLGNSDESYLIELKSEADCIVSKTNSVLSQKINSTVSPNPFVDYAELNINATENMNLELSILDLLGKTHYSQNVNVNQGDNKIGFSTPGLAEGMYIVTLSNGSEFTSHKVFVEAK